MKIVFLSNYFNHHQRALADELNKQTNGNYFFIETQAMEAERINMGWGVNETPSYVIKSYVSDNLKKCQEIIDSADVVIIGSAPMTFIKKRLNDGKLTFLYTERLYKKKYQKYKWPIRAWRLFWQFGRYKNLYLLCASAYSAADFAKTFTFINKAFKWGYFPEVKKYDDVDKILELKHPASILWVARLIELKHPELPILVAKKLKEEGYDFQMNLIGNGELNDWLKETISNYNLQNDVHLLGSMTPTEVRSHMEKSQIFMFTSDRNEGWGAVLNESMNSACAVVASHAIGSVPFLIKDKINGLIYKDGDFDDLYLKVKSLILDQELAKQLGKNAYNTMANEWCPSNAASKFIEVAQRLLEGKKDACFEDGVCSKADILKDDWYKND